MFVYCTAKQNLYGFNLVIFPRRQTLITETTKCRRAPSEKPFLQSVHHVHVKHV